MCGFCGFFQRKQKSSSLKKRIQWMTDRLVHRGPDDFGTWVDTPTGIALGQRRLSIIDLSPAGHQPMFSACGRFVIVFNGEIYNYQEIRDELERAGAAPAWRGASDTEVMLAAFAHFGVAASLPRFNGMFAFALWDKSERVLTLGRDRMGKKPLYYGFNHGVFLFGSELKALRAHPDFQPELDEQAIAQFLRYSYIPGPFSIYKGIFKLRPASFCTLTWDDLNSGTLPPAECFWDLPAVAARQVASPFAGTFQEAKDELERLLLDAVRIRMIADVPLGAFFSGGIDSTLVVALMQAQSNRPVRTFTIGFEDENYNEAGYARAIAAHLGTDHTELTATFDQAREVIPRLSWMYDEPFADSSQIPTYLVSKLTREHVTVALSGDGGDEVFGGYNRYVRAPQVWRVLSLIPPVMRRALGNPALMRPAQLVSLFYFIRRLAPGFFAHREPELKLHKILQLLSSSNELDVYHRLTSMHPAPETFCDFPIDPQRDPHFTRSIPEGFSFPQAMQLWDMQTYLTDDILVKVDRATMAASLESRAPLLDYRLVEFAWSLPMEWKIQKNQGKFILREILKKYLPPALWQRPKTGFAIPLYKWYQDQDLTRHLGLEQATSPLLAAGLDAVELGDFLKRGTNVGSFGFTWNLLMLNQWMDNAS